MRHRCAASSFLRYSFNGSISISVGSGEDLLPGEALPEGRCSAFALRQSSCAARMGEFTLKEGLLPG